ncbi:MAG: ribonuclease G, partial [Clostridia bacterium]|nr:ribonuclease G [Clostridia bacterium]
MEKEILVQSHPEATVVALVEDGRLAEIHLERTAGRRLVGNIYKGRVANILPGMQAAFVDLGIGRNGFLYLKEPRGGAG